MKKYEVRIIRWEPQKVIFEIEAENALAAKHQCLEAVRTGNFESSEIENTIPIRTTVLKCNRLRATEAA